MHNNDAYYARVPSREATQASLDSHDSLVPPRRRLVSQQSNNRFPSWIRVEKE